MIIVYVKILT